MEISLIENITESYFLDLLELYKQEDWTRNRKPEDIKVMIDNCKTIGLIDKEVNKLIGFSRVITDFVYRATIYDVIILNDYQGKGLGKLLIESIVNHPQIKEIERMELYCSGDKVEFYNKWSFNKVTEMTNFMRRINKPM